MTNQQKPEIILHMCYYYKGSTNVNVGLRNTEDGIDIVSDFGEVMTNVQSGADLADFLRDLAEGEYS
jgi:hypothetical protein